jgi:hypothetical protein
MADCATQRTLKEAHMQLTPSVSRHRTSHSSTNFDKTCQLTGTVCGPARRPHFSLAIISATVQLWTYVFWVILACFNMRNTLLKPGNSSWESVYLAKMSVTNIIRLLMFPSNKIYRISKPISSLIQLSEPPTPDISAVKLKEQQTYAPCTLTPFILLSQIRVWSRLDHAECQ